MVDSESIRQCACTVNPPRPATPSAGDLHPVTTVYLITRGKTVVAKGPDFYISTYIDTC